MVNTSNFPVFDGWKFSQAVQDGWDPDLCEDYVVALSVRRTATAMCQSLYRGRHEDVRARKLTDELAKLGVTDADAAGLTVVGMELFDATTASEVIGRDAKSVYDTALPSTPARA
jgi:hypothetical protein